jgi:hypothetical protein
MLFILFVIWAILATIVAGLALTRKLASRDEDDSLHVGQASVNARQLATAHTLDVIDKWGKLMTIIVGVYGLGLLAAFVYQSWLASSQINVN